MNQSEELLSLKLRVEALESEVVTLREIIAAVNKPRKPESSRRKVVKNDLSDSVTRGLSGDPAPPLAMPKGPGIS